MAGPISRNTLPILSRLGITPGADQFVQFTSPQVMLTLPVGGLIGCDDLQVETGSAAAGLGTNILYTNSANQGVQMIYGFTVQSNAPLGAGVSCAGAVTIISQGGAATGFLGVMSQRMSATVGGYFFTGFTALDNPIALPQGYSLGALIDILVAGPPTLQWRVLKQVRS